jgi:SpoVK/Ycf46/Vps4 family AAA+-type ATPase
MVSFFLTSHFFLLSAVAATNIPWEIDEAVLRYAQINFHIHLDLQ